MVNIVTSDRPRAAPARPTAPTPAGHRRPGAHPRADHRQDRGTATATPGQQVTYTITVTDTGQTPYTGATVTDDLTGLLDDAAYGADATATTGAVSYASPGLTWTGNLTPGQAATITYTVTVHNPETGDKILTNTVTSAAAGSNCPRRIHRPPVRQHGDGGAADHRLTADVSTTIPGGVVHYTTTLTNTGQTPYYGISMTADGSGLADDAVGNADQTATSGSFAIGATGAVWSGDIPVGGTVTLTGSVTVNNPDTGDHVLTRPPPPAPRAATARPAAPTPAAAPPSTCSPRP